MLPGLRIISAIRPSFRLAGSLWLVGLVASAAEEETDFPAIPKSAVDAYTVTQVYERIESVDVPQLRATGRLLTFQMDPVDSHSTVPAPEGVSLRLEHYANPQLQVDLSSFAREAFEFGLSEETLRQYLAGIAQTMTEEQNFKILEEPVITTGPARFRFLGQRAIPLRYRFRDKGVDLTRAENWFRIGDNIHVISIQGPSRFFDTYFESIRVPFNSSVAIGN
jgi:hypothetical protein